MTKYACIFFVASFDEPPNDLPPPPPESPPPESDDEDSKKSVSDTEEAKSSTESAQEEKKASLPVSPPGEYVFKYDPELQSFEGAKVEKDDNSVKDENEIEVTKEAEKPVDGVLDLLDPDAAPKCPAAVPVRVRKGRVEVVEEGPPRLK